MNKIVVSCSAARRTTRGGDPDDQIYLEQIADSVASALRGFDLHGGVTIELFDTLNLRTLHKHQRTVDELAEDLTSSG